MARFRKVSGFFVLDQLKMIMLALRSVPACVEQLERVEQAEQVGTYKNQARIRPRQLKIYKFPAYHNELDRAIGQDTDKVGPLANLDRTMRMI